ncbi:MAG TPA: hypothetical protein V6C85_05575 [Allocoleopsis sp.]
MPSDSSGRYQSRFFNFLNRQSLRLSDRFDRAVRHVKVAATWGVQILIYPIYLLTQATLSAGRQLASAAEAGWSPVKALANKPEEPSTPPTVDTPIQRVLDAVNTLSLPEASELVVLQPGGLSVVSGQGLAEKTKVEPQERTDRGLAKYGALAAQQASGKRYEIRGIATLLETRSLVLVSDRNQILDILTPEQQKKLLSKISWELAGFMRQRRVALALEAKKAALTLTTLERRSAFLPLRMFWHVMAWVQSSPVAIAANVFGESTLVDGELLSSDQLLLSLRPPQARGQLLGSNSQLAASAALPESLKLPLPKDAIVFLDRTVAELESHQLVPGSEAMVELASRTSHLLRERTEKFLAPLQSKFITARGEDLSTETSQAHVGRIQSLIYAAIDYFFGKRSSQGLTGASEQQQWGSLSNSQGRINPLSGRSSTSLPSVTPPPSLEGADDSIPDPWLSWSDLYGNPDASDLTQNSASYPPSPSQAQAGTVAKSNRPNRNSQSQLPEGFGSKIPGQVGRSIWGFLKRSLNPKQSSGKLSVRGTAEPTLEPQMPAIPTRKPKASRQGLPLQPQDAAQGTVPAKSKSRSLVTTSSPNTSVSPATAANTALTTSDSAPNTDLQPTPDWIEAKVTTTGYVKHPLEKILGAIDHAMLWLEELALKVWEWVKRMTDKS